MSEQVKNTGNIGSERPGTKDSSADQQAQLDAFVRGIDEILASVSEEMRTDPDTKITLKVLREQRKSIIERPEEIMNPDFIGRQIEAARATIKANTERVAKTKEAIEEMRQRNSGKVADALEQAEPAATKRPSESPLGKIIQENGPKIWQIGHVTFGTASKDEPQHSNQDALFVDVKNGSFVLADGMSSESMAGAGPELAARLSINHLLGIPMENTLLDMLYKKYLENNKISLDDAINFLKKNGSFNSDLPPFIINAKTQPIIEAFKLKTTLLTKNFRTGSTALIAKRIEKNTYRIKKVGDTVYFKVDKNGTIVEKHGLSKENVTTGYMYYIKNGKPYFDTSALANEFNVTLGEGETLVLATDFIEDEAAVKDFIAAKFGEKLDFNKFRKEHKHDDATFIAIGYDSGDGSTVTEEEEIKPLDASTTPNDANLQTATSGAPPKKPEDGAPKKPDPNANDDNETIDEILKSIGLTSKEPPANAGPTNPAPPSGTPEGGTTGSAAEPDEKPDTGPNDGLSDGTREALESDKPPTEAPDAPASGDAPSASPSNGPQPAPTAPTPSPSNGPQPAPTAPAPTPAKSSFFSGLFNYLGYPFHLGGKVAGSVAKLAKNGYQKVLAPGAKFLRTHKWQVLATVATGGLYGLYKLARTETVTKAAVKAFNVGKMPVVLAADIVTGKLQYKFYEKYVRGVLMKKLRLTNAGDYLNDKLNNTGRFVASIPVVGVPFRLLSKFQLPNLTPWLNTNLLGSTEAKKPDDKKPSADAPKPEEPKPEDTAAALTPAAQAEKLEATKQQAAAGDKPAESKPTENKPTETKAAA